MRNVTVLLCVVKWVSIEQIVNLWGEERGGGKGKAIPLQAWTGPEGSKRLRLPDF